MVRFTKEGEALTYTCIRALLDVSLRRADEVDILNGSLETEREEL